MPKAKDRKTIKCPFCGAAILMVAIVHYCDEFGGAGISADRLRQVAQWKADAGVLNEQKGRHDGEE